MVAGSDNYTVDTLGYYVGGDLTASSQMADLASASATAYYSGTAYATLWNPMGGLNMTGYMHMNVSFNGGATAINNFVFEVFDGGVSDLNKGYAFISGASGTITGTDFELNVSTGSWGMDVDGFNNSIPFDDNGTIPVATRDGRGSFYGANAAKTGGIVAMQGSTSGAMNGMFEATQTTPPP